MTTRVLLVVAAYTVIYGCGQACSPVERQEQQGGVEAVAEQSTPKPDASTEQAEADAAKAAAAEQELTLEDLERLDDRKEYDRQIILGLLACQIRKYEQANGEQALDAFME